MKSIKADKRIKAITDMIPVSDCLADIGCDHGKTSALVLITDKVKRVIASDISKPSLSKAVRLAEQLAVSSRIDFRVGDGLAVLQKDEAETIVIAGIGGELMAHILTDGKAVLTPRTQLVLAPNNRESLIREWMLQNHFIAKSEKLIKQSGKFYQVMLASYGEIEQLSPLEFEIGRLILSSNTLELNEYLTHKLNRTNQALRNIKNNLSESTVYQHFLLKRNQYEEALECLKSQKS